MRGNKAREAKDDNEQRVYTWRYPGKLHNRLLALLSKKNQSINYYLTKAITRQVEEDESKQ